MFSLQNFKISQNKLKHWTRLINQRNFKFQMLHRWLASQEGFNIKWSSKFIKLVQTITKLLL
jgi:hypothetical protein